MFGIGDEIAGYRVEQVLGAGGMGEVYRVAHPRLPRSDAIKVLRSAHGGDPVVRQRFEREADLMAPLAHPNLVRVYDRGGFGDVLWIAMELVPGTDASRLSAGSPAGLDPRLVVNIVNGVAAGLDMAHRHGVLHRDIKPANILITPGPDPVMPDAVKVTDFGIAQALGEAGAALTSTGTTVGTMRYCSPEQIDGRGVDGRSDVYSLAATTFELLTGSAPFDSNSLQGLMTAHLFAEPPRASERSRSLPAAVDAVLAAGLAKDPGLRPATATAFALALFQAFTGGRVDVQPSGQMFANTPGTPITGPHQSYGVPVTSVAPKASPAKRRVLAAVGVVAAVVVGATAGSFWGSGSTLSTPERPDVQNSAKGVDLTWPAVAGATSYVVKQNDEVVQVSSEPSAHLTPRPGRYRYSVSARSEHAESSPFSSATADVQVAQTWRAMADIAALYPDLLPTTPVSTDGYQGVVCQGTGPSPDVGHRRAIFCNKPTGENWVRDYSFQVIIYSYGAVKDAELGAAAERFGDDSQRETITTTHGVRGAVRYGDDGKGGAKAVMSYMNSKDPRAKTVVSVIEPRTKNAEGAFEILKKLPI